MKGKYTYGDLIKAIQSFGIEATEPKINDLSKLSFDYPNMSLRMIIRRKTFWCEELQAEYRLLKNKCELLEEDLTCIDLWLDNMGASKVGDKGNLSIIGRIIHLLQKQQNDKV